MSKSIQKPNSVSMSESGCVVFVWVKDDKIVTVSIRKGEAACQICQAPDTYKECGLGEALNWLEES